MNKLSISLLIVFALGCNKKRDYKQFEPSGTDCPGYVAVTFAEFAKDPAQYENKKIRIEGYFQYEFENVAIYESEGREIASGIWLDFDHRQDLAEKDLLMLDDKFIDIIGTFDFSSHGHLGQYIGQLQVDCIEGYSE